MKKLLLVAMSALMLVSFAACKKSVEPKDMMNEFARIALENDNDCKVAAEKLGAYIDANGEAWATWMAGEIKAAAQKGEDYEKLIDKFMTPSDDLKAKLDASKCYTDDAMDSVSEKLGKVVMAKVLPVVAELEAAKAVKEDTKE